MILLSIDPGACTGFALFVNGELADCGLLDARKVPLTIPLTVRPDVCVIERPDGRPNSANRMSPADMCTLGIRIGKLQQAACAERTIEVEPNDWKGSTSKAISHNRTAAAMTPEERDRVLKCLAPYAPGDRHNALDAIGIGLRYLKRTRV